MADPLQLFQAGAERAARFRQMALNILGQSALQKQRLAAGSPLTKANIESVEALTGQRKAAARAYGVEEQTIEQNKTYLKKYSEKIKDSNLSSEFKGLVDNAIQTGNIGAVEDALFDNLKTGNQIKEMMNLTGEMKIREADKIQKGETTEKEMKSRMQLYRAERDKIIRALSSEKIQGLDEFNQPKTVPKYSPTVLLSIFSNIEQGKNITDFTPKQLEILNDKNAMDIINNLFQEFNKSLQYTRPTNIPNIGNIMGNAIPEQPNNIGKIKLKSLE